MQRRTTIWLILLVSLIIAIAVIWETVPVVRYYFIPVTGGTAAPKSFGVQESDPPRPAGRQRLFANRHKLVPSINQVPAEGGWINSPPLNLQALEKKGNVILVDFWTYTCINCIRANPFDELYWRRYKDHGLVIIGVASPEFKIEGVPRNVLIGVKREGLTYPILMDAHKKVWRQFGNHFWPGKYLINPDGKIVYTKFGEGDYEKEERVIRHALNKAGHKNLGPDRPLEPKLDLIPANRNQTPELYAGPNFLRRSLGNQKQPQNAKVTAFKMPHTLKKDRIYLEGKWRGHGGFDASVGRGAIGLNYLAQAPYVVLNSAGGRKRVEVTLDGRPVPPLLRGRDIKFENGKTWMIVNQPRLYWPIANHTPYGRHTIRFKVPPGVHLYSFTFGVYQ